MKSRLRSHIERSASRTAMDPRGAMLARLRKSRFLARLSCSNLPMEQRIARDALLHDKGYRPRLMEKAMRLGADLNSPIFTAAFRPLDYAAMVLRDPRSCLALVALGAKPAAPDRDGRCLAHFSVLSGSVEMFKFALLNFADQFELMDTGGRRPLELAFDFITGTHMWPDRSKALDWVWAHADELMRERILDHGMEWSLRAHFVKCHWRRPSARFHIDFEWLFKKGAKIDTPLLKSIIEAAPAGRNAVFARKNLAPYFAIQEKNDILSSLEISNHLRSVLLARSL